MDCNPKTKVQAGSLGDDLKLSTCVELNTGWTLVNFTFQMVAIYSDL